MTTFALTKSSTYQDWCVFVAIEGVGVYLDAATLAANNADARFRFCTSLPAFASVQSTALWYDYLQSVPDLLSERCNILGGMPEHGSCSVEIVDVGDLLSSAIQPNRYPVSVLTADISSTATTVSVGDETRLPVGSVCWVGAEAMAIDLSFAGSLTVRRGYLGTIQSSHASGANVSAACPYIIGRRMSIYIAPSSAASESEAIVAGEYVVSDVGWDDTLNVWVIAGKSQTKYFDAILPRRSNKSTISAHSTVSNGNISYTYITVENVVMSTWKHWGTGGYAKIGDEIVRMAYDDYSGMLIERGLFGTPISDKPLVGQSISRVLCAMDGGQGYSLSSFRFSPGPTPSTSRASGTWTPSDHWCDIIRCMMVSSADDTDELDEVNYVAAYGNFSSLPVGFGLGLPAAQIDWQSWATAKARTPEWKFGALVFGDEAVEFGEWLEEQFLRPIGAYISYASGTAKIVVPRSPSALDTGIVIGPTNILSRTISSGQTLPIVSAKQSTRGHTGSILYEINGGQRTIIVNSTNYAGTYGQRGVYSTAEKPVKFALNGLSLTEAGAEDSVFELAAKRLYRFERPMIEFSAVCDMSIWPIYPGSVVSISMDDIPNLKGRGFTSVLAEVIEVEVEMDSARDGGGTGVSVRIVAVTYSDSATRLVAPAAYIASVVTNTCTIAENRYTADAAEDVGLPGQDWSAFTAGSLVSLRERNGASATSPATMTQIISSTSAQTIVLDGNFGGALASTKVLVLARYDVATTSDKGLFAFLASTLDQYIGASSDAAMIYGES